MDTSSKNHKKKRSIYEGYQEPQPGPSSSDEPTHHLLRSYRNPNRFMYPYSRRKTCCHGQSSSSEFVKASELRNQLPQSINEEKSHSDNADSNVASQKQTCSEKFRSTLVQTVVTSFKRNSKTNEVLQSECSTSAETNADLETRPVLIKKNVSKFSDDTDYNASLTGQGSGLSGKCRSTSVQTVITSFKDSGKSRKASQNKLSATAEIYKPLISHSAFIGKRKRKVGESQVNKIFRYLKRPDNFEPKVHRQPVVKFKDVVDASLWEKKDDEFFRAITELRNEQFFKNYRDCYGLVENNIIENAGENYFNILPLHIIENILSQVPMLDLLSCRAVCTKWNEIIDSKKFMEWKKSYYKLKVKSDLPFTSAKQKMSDLLSSLDYISIESGIPVLIKYMGKTFNRMPSSDMYALLMKNPKGELADKVLRERFPEWIGKEARVWCQLAIAVLISETVWDILDLYKCLYTSTSACSRTDVINALYCIATFLLYFRLVDGINSGLHYRLYYALYLIENHIPSAQRGKLKIIQGIPGQQSMHHYGQTDRSSLTYEQIRILNHQFDMEQKIRIIALAGTGKTTTLLHLARLYPQVKFLNIVFNKSVSDDAKRKFPPNVTCKTAHSLAYSEVGRFLRHKLTSSLRPYDLISHIKHNEEHMQIFTYANLVLTTINNFTLSSSAMMDITHVPSQDFSHKSISFGNKTRILKDALMIWDMMLDKDNQFKITHDIYLKLYHLKRPNLNAFQCIMVDEAQDCNPVILDIVLSQTMPVIFVGDPNQQIYGFRGAQNAMQSFKATHTYHLTKSFRFGPEIAYIASCILELLLNSRRSTIVGSTNDSYINGKVIGKYAIISRTNIMLFNEALRMVVFKRLKVNEPTVINATFAGGFNSYGFDQITDIYKLKHKDTSLKDGFIARFKSYSDLVNYARYSDDSDLLSKIEIVNQHGHDISKFISILKERCCYSIDVANVIFSTAHKSKGLEFDTVCLTDDYPISTVPSLFNGDSPRDEANILYVAVTRAKKCLLLPEKITKVLHLAYEKFEYPVASKSIFQDNAALTCTSCDATFTPHTVLMLIRRKVVMASEREIKPGPLCMKCGSDPYMRPDVHVNGLVMYLDPTQDNYHRFMSSIVGPLPSDPPIVYDKFAEFQNAERVFVINLNLHI